MTDQILNPLFESHFDQLEKRAAARRATQLSLGTFDPEAAAEGIQIGKELRIPPQAVLGDPETFRSRAAQRRSTTALTGAPKMQDWISDPVNGSIAKDDLDNLTWFEKQLGPMARAAGRGVRRLSAIPSDLSSGADSVRARDVGKTYEQILGEEIERAGGQRVWDALPAANRVNAMQVADARFNAIAGQGEAERIGYIKRGAESLSRASEIMRISSGIPMSDAAMEFRDGTLSNAENTVMGTLGAFLDDPLRGAAFIAETAAETLPVLAASTGATVLTRSPSAGVAVLSTGSFLTENTTSAIEFLNEKGIDISTPEAAALVLQDQDLMREAKELGAERGLIIALFDAVSGGVAGQTLLNSPAGEVVAQGLAQIALGSGGEAAAQLATTGEIDAREVVIEGLAELATAPIEVVGVGGRGLIKDLTRRGRSGETANLIDQIDAAAAESQVKSRSSEKFMEALRASGLNDESMYVSAEGLQEYFQAKDLQIEDGMLDEWGISASDFQEKLASGGDVAIPVDAYASRISGTEDAEWFKNNATFSPDEMSVSEAEAFNSQVRDVLDEALADAENARLNDEEMKSSDTQIYNQVFSDLRAAGRSPDVAQNEASVWSAFWRSMGERYGEDPLDLAKSMGVQIRGVQSDPARRRGQMDIMLNTLRKNGDNALAPRGDGVLEFVKGLGGVYDRGGDVEALGDPKLVAETRAEISEQLAQPSMDGIPAERRGKGLDEIGRALIEAGYFPEYLGGADVQADGTVVDEAALALEAISEAVAGRDRYRDGEGPDQDLTMLAEALSERGIDLAASNDEIVAALEDGQEYDQSGQLATDTPEFRAWFGDSKVVDESGKPLVVYHGTTRDFEAFDLSRGGDNFTDLDNGLAFFTPNTTHDEYTTGDGIAAVANDPYSAGAYARGSGVVMPVYLSIKNPMTLADFLYGFSYDVSTPEAARESADDFMSDAGPIQDILDENKAEIVEIMRDGGFDGIAFEYGGESVFAITDPTQAKSVFNRGTFDASDPRILFQSGPEKPLAVTHNISAKGLEIADGMGGLAAPSLGVVRADIGPLDGFGEITLIGGPDLADPRRSGVRSFNSDVYSVRQPRALTEVSKKSKKEIEGKLDGAAVELGSSYFEVDSNDLERYGLTHLADLDEVKLAYLRAKGTPFKIKMKKKPKVSAKMKRMLSSDIYSVRQDPKQMEAIAAEFRGQAQELVDKFPDRFPDVNSTRFFDDNGEPNNNLIRDLIWKVQQAKGKPQVDTYDARARLLKKIEASGKSKSDFLAWVEDEFGGLMGDLFFEDSRGRKKPYDLDNLVRSMRGKVRDAEGFNYGVGNIRSNMAREFSSITEVKDARSDIVTKKEFEAVKAEVATEFDALIERLKSHIPGGENFGFYNEAAEFIGDFAKGKSREWSQHLVEPLSEDLTADIKSFLNGLSVLPTEYFEVKMQRAVDFSEFSVALVPKKASKETIAILKKHGLQVRKYDSQSGDGRGEAMKKLNPKTFFQGESEKRGSIVLPRGGLTEGQTVINLFESADLSTFLHESGHFFLEAFSALASSENAPAAMAEDLAAIHKFLKVEDGSSLTTEQHETWARGFEAYLMEGKAPSLELASAFARFKAWMSRIYRTVKGLNVNLNPEIREVMDRMLATDSEIKAMRDEMGMRPLFKDRGPAGMSEADFATYQRMAARSTEQAEQRLMKKTMAKVRRETEAWFKAEKKEVKKEVESMSEGIPAYQLVELLSGGSWLGNPDQDAPDVQMDRAALVDMFDDGVLAELSRSKLGGKRAIYKKGGEDLGVIADMFNFESVPAMIEALQNAGKRSDFIKAETDRIMLERHGDPLSDGSIEEAAALAIHSDQQAATVATEARAIAKRLGRPTQNLKAKIFRQRARVMIGRMSVREASRPAAFLKAERQAARAAERAFARVARGGRNTEAALGAAMDAKERQLLNSFLYKEARDFETKLKRGREKMRSYGKKAVRAKLEGGYIEQIDTLLDRFDFRVRSNSQVARSETLRNYIDRMVEEGRGGDLNIDSRLLDEARRQHYSRLSVDELMGLFDTIANIDHMGRFKQTLIDRQRRRDLNKSAAGLAALVRKRFGSNKVDKQSGSIRNGFNLLMRVDTIAADIDGSEIGQFYDEIKRGLDEGATLEQKMNVDSAKAIGEIFSVYDASEKKDMNKERVIPGGNGRPWTKQQVLALALNQGNENNQQRVLDPRVHESVRLTKDQMDATLATLTKNDWDFVQNVWDFVDTFWPELSAVTERRTGVKLKRVEASPVVTPHGTYRGGYYPIAYDPLKSKAAAVDEESAFDRFLSAGRGEPAKVADGMAQARQNTGGGRALNYDFSVMLRHVRDTARVIALSEPVDNSYRLLNHEAVHDAFRDGGVSHLHRTLNLYLRDVGTGPVYNDDPINGWSRIIKNNFTLSRLAFNFKTVALQVTGLGQSAAVIGKMNLLKGFNEYRKDPRAASADVMAKSPFMAERQSTFQKDIYDQANDLRLSSPIDGAARKAKSEITAWGFAPMTKVQFYAVDLPTWIGAYQAEFSKNGGDEAKAIHFADRMVDRSQGGGLMTDRNALERGTLSRNMRQSDFVRLWTTLGGYMVTKMNRGYLTAKSGARAVRDADTAAEAVGQAVSMATDLALLYVFEAAMMGLAYSMLSDDEDDEELIAFMAKEVVGATFGGIPFVNQSVGAFNGYGAGGVLSSALEVPSNIFTQIKQGDNDKAFRRSVADAVGFATGMPTTQTMRIIEELVEGEGGSLAEAMIGRNPLDN